MSPRHEKVGADVRTPPLAGNPVDGHVAGDEEAGEGLAEGVFEVGELVVVEGVFGHLVLGMERELSAIFEGSNTDRLGHVNTSARNRAIDPPEQRRKTISMIRLF